jgi:leucyl aminopeptidase
LGSRHIAQVYKNEGKKVHAYANIDMTGYKHPSDSTVGVILDNTHPALNEFFIKVIKAYSNVTVRTWRCGYACGDHYSWYVAGFRALVYPHEVTSMRHLNPHYHTDQDTVDKFDLDRATEFVKFTLGFAVEMANN